METWLQHLGGGKNVKLFYFAGSYMRRLIPRRWLMLRRRAILDRLRQRPDFPDIKRRIDYYCRFTAGQLTDKAQPIGDKQHFDYCAKVYLLDSEEARRYFPKHLRWQMTPGDNTTAHTSPTVVKSRPIADGESFDVLLKLNRVRHFIFLRDRVRWEDKKPIALFRGRIGRQMRRLEFIRRFDGSELVDAGCIDLPEGVEPHLQREKMTLYEHFRYRYIVCLEGNDVASNLKWAMHSHSTVIMPRPRHETWFMEGRLIPGVHYIEICDDYSDLEDKILYYNAHPDEARAISRNAREWTRQFKNRRLERHIAVAVMHNYLVRTGQLNEPEI